MVLSASQKLWFCILFIVIKSVLYVQHIKRIFFDMVLVFISKNPLGSEMHPNDMVTKP